MGARIVGCCRIDPGAVIEDEAIIHDSVVLDGAVVGRRAAVSRSIVGPLATVAPGRRVVEQVIAQAGRRTRRGPE